MGVKRVYLTQYSGALHREMHVIVYGHGGWPLIAFPCQDGMCDNWESFHMQDALADEIDGGKIQLFLVDTVDTESFSDVNGDKAHRAWMQECYYQYIVNELVPLVQEVNRTQRLPYVVGFSLGASHAAIALFRAPQLFAGMLGCSGCYDTPHFWDGWCDETLYNNSPVHFLANMPEDHPWISEYRKKKIILVVGQGQWERESNRTIRIMRAIFEQKGIPGWCDLWGYDVDHDWPWWIKQIRYHLPHLLES